MPQTQTQSYAFQERQKYIEKTNKLLSELPEYCDRFIYNQLNGTKRLQPRTVFAYAGDLSLFFYYLTINNPLCKDLKPHEISVSILSNLTVDDMEEFYTWTASYNRDGKTYTNGPAAQKRKISSISALYRFLMKKDYLKANPCSLLDKERLHDKPIIALTDRQQERFIEAIGTPSRSGDVPSQRSEKIKDKYTSLRDMAIAYVFLGTGMRVSELVGLNLGDLDLEGKYFIITRKGGKIQQLFFGEEVSEVLSLYLHDCRPKMLPGKESLDYDALFLSLHHKRISVRQVENVIKEIARTALSPAEAERISCHKLRSTYGTRLLKGSNSIALVAEVLGHADISTTKRRYAAVQNLSEAPKYVSIIPGAK